MKEAYWGYGLFLLFLFGLFIFYTASKTTVRDQQEYNNMKSQVEASMLDAIDWPAYKSGFYVCTGKSKSGGVYKMTSKSDYSIHTCLNTPGACDSEGNLKALDKAEGLPSGNTCIGLVAEYKIDDASFREIVEKRLHDIMSDYKVEVLDVVEYPPKVTVRVSYNETITNTLDSNGNEHYDVVNEMTAVLEDNGAVNFLVNGVPSNPAVNSESFAISASGSDVVSNGGGSSSGVTARSITVPTGWSETNGRWQYYDSNGNAVTGWQQLGWSRGTDWFYFDSNGNMLTGWQKLSWSKGNDWFYFDPSTGAMLHDTSISYKGLNYKFDSNGKCISHDCVNK